MNHRNIIRIIGLTLLIISSFIYISSLIQWIIEGGADPLGENLVNKEIVVINNILMFKPISIAMVTGALGYIMILESIKDPFKTNRRILIAKTSKIIAYAFLIISAYEFIFNMMLWAAYIIVNGGTINIDEIYTHFPYTHYSWNIVFATKLFFMILVISLATIYYISRWEKQQL